MLNQISNIANNAMNEYDKLTEYPTPIFRVEVDGVDISPQMATFNVTQHQGQSWSRR